MSTYKIIGGTAGYNKISEDNEPANFAKRLYMFKQEAKVSAVFISKKTHLNGVILPAFDSSLDKTDTAYKSGYSPYRIKNVSDPETGCPYFSDWFVTLEGYNYYGKNKMNFFSPKSFGCPDPIQDIRSFCWKKHNAGDLSYDYLINRPEKFGDPYALPKPAKLTMINVVCPATYDKDPVQGDANRIMILKSAATDRLLEDLNEATPRGMTPISDSEWAELFCRGDITDPSAAMQFTTAMDKLDNGMEYAYLSLGRLVIENGHRALRYNSKVITEDQLLGRYDLTDTENIISVPSYQDIVDMLVQDKLIPFELIQEVCGEKANVTRDIKSDDSDSYADEDAPSMSNPPAPAPAPVYVPEPAQAPTPAPAPAPSVEKMFVTVDGKTVQMTVDEINDMQDPDLPVYDGGAWKPAVKFSWYELRNIPQPATSKPEPALVAPAPMPSASSAARRTKEQEDRFKTLNTKLTLDEMITTEEINELATLTRMLPFQG